MSIQIKARPPVLILGGSSNALSIARSLAKMRVEVYLSVQQRNCAYFSRYAKEVIPFDDKNTVDQFWHELLIDQPFERFQGAVLWACNDDAIDFIAKNHTALKERYILDDAIPELQIKLLNKLSTLKMAQSLGIPTPKFLEINEVSDVREQSLSEFEYPVLVKPQQSHLFQKAFGGHKFFLVYNKSELLKRLEEVIAKDLNVIISEMIPGPDEQLRSYYTYIGKENEPLFHFTKAVLRRFPKNHGQGCYHFTVWEPKVAEIGLKFFQGIGFRGLGNIEFKYDTRDGLYKVIESNPRFTAAHELLVRCGMDISQLIYCYLAGLPLPKIEIYRENVTLIFPQRDFYAFLELRKAGELTTGQWLKSVLRPHALPHFSWKDPLPTIMPFYDSLKQRLSGGKKQDMRKKIIGKAV
jgi:predicted ATP-grasp superfamily ATP-dependent carboligase